MKILANDGISPSGKDKLEAAGFQVSTARVEQADLADHMNSEQYVALLVRSATKVRKDLIDLCPNLKLIGRGGVGMDNIDVAYAKERGIHVINTPAASSLSVAELVMAHLFTICRSLHLANREMPSRGHDDFAALKKSCSKGIELRGKTLGIIGFGRIGQAVAAYALGCGMRVVACTRDGELPKVHLDIQGQDSIAVEITALPLEKLLETSDFVSLHVPKQPSGASILTAKEFAMMKKGAAVINTSRGGIVDETDLLSALEQGQLSYAALDVFSNEPSPRKELLNHPQISVTPHIGAASIEAQDRIGEELAQQIISLLKERVRQ